MLPRAPDGATVTADRADHGQYDAWAQGSLYQVECVTCVTLCPIEGLITTSVELK